jgi:hypothetical protein
LQHEVGRFRFGIHPAAPVDRPRGVKSQYRATRHANAIAGHDAQHQRTGRQARPVDHHVFARSTHPVEQFEEWADLAARTGEDANLALRRRGESAQRYEENAFCEDTNC